MNSENLTRQETAARAAQLRVHSIAVDVDLAEAPDHAQKTFGTRSTLRFDSRVSETWVDFIGAAVHRVTVNGADQEVEYDGARILLRGLQEENEVVIEAAALYSRSGEGLHRFVDPADGETYLYTQYEPADSRRVMACFEQPDMKATYRFTVRAPESWTVLSNQSIAHHEVVDGVRRVEFAETLPISSYITSVAAGPYASVSGTWDNDGETVALGVYCRASLAEFLEADEILTVTRQGLDFFTEAFDYPYPWGKYDQIFVPEYNLGAMENPGLVTFTEAYIWRGAATDSQRAQRANTILHEMSHMWFGDLVTMQWWDALWLKESFADYMGAHSSAVATRFTDAWVKFAVQRKQGAYRQDQLPSTHPIMANIPDLEAAKLNFDGITYQKGASALKQLVSFVGEESFFAGARAYFRKHAFGNTTMEDLLVELEDVSGKDVRSWAHAWLETTGVTTFWIEDAEGQKTLMQSASRPHHLRIGLFDLMDGVIMRRDIRELDVSAERTPLGELDADLVLINDGDLTYAKARLGEHDLDTVETALSTLDDALARAVIWGSLWNATRDGELAAKRYLRIVENHAAAERNIGILNEVVANAGFVVSHYVAESDRAAVRSRWSALTAAAMEDAAAGSDAQLVWARAFAAACAYDRTSEDRARAILAGGGPAGLRVDPELRWTLWSSLATAGVATPEEIAGEVDRDGSSRGKIAALRALSSFPVAQVRHESWRRAWSDERLSNEELDAVIAGTRAGDSRRFVAEFDRTYFDGLESIWSSRSIEMAGRIVPGLFPAAESTASADEWLQAHPDAPAALRRIIIEQSDHLARELRVRAAQSRLPDPLKG